MSHESRDDSGSAEPGLTRRRAIQLGAVAAGTLAYGVAGSPAEGAPGAPTREWSFDEDWRFHRGDVDGAETPWLDDSAWRTLDLPHDWSIEDLPYAISDDGAATSDPSLLTTRVPPAGPAPPPVIGPFDPARSTGGGSTGYTVGGVAWYRKHFRPPDDGSVVEVRFDGVYQNADVWLNGTHLGFHPFGYTGFGYDLTPHLDRRGPNVLAVRVDNSGRTSRWYSGSGIYRHTWLTVTGAVRIPLWGVSVTTPEVSERRARVQVEVDVAGPAPAQVRVTILDPRGRAVARRQAPAGAPLSLVVTKPARWSPESPARYTARAEVLTGGRVVDTVETRFGIRTLVWNGAAGFALNGQSVKIVGGCLHHDNGPMGAVALGRSEERRVRDRQDHHGRRGHHRRHR